MELIIVPLEYNIVRARAYYSREGAVDEHIEHLVEAYAPFISHSAAEERGENEAEGDNDSVELDAYLVSEERELDKGRRDVESPLDPCEIDGREIGHIHHPLILRCKVIHFTGFIPLNYRSKLISKAHSAAKSDIFQRFSRLYAIGKRKAEICQISL